LLQKLKVSGAEHSNAQENGTKHLTETSSRFTIWLHQNLARDNNTTTQQEIENLMAGQLQQERYIYALPDRLPLYQTTNNFWRKRVLQSVRRRSSLNKPILSCH
jgi:hypothetical protein